MTKEEYLNAKEMTVKYQRLESELNKADAALNNIKSYSYFALVPRTNSGNINIPITKTIRDKLAELIQDYKDSISEQMEEL